MIKIDAEKCIDCLNCTKVCPFLALVEKDGKPVPGISKLCIGCLHCAAACPQNAISLNDMEGTTKEKMPEMTLVHQDWIRRYLMGRRSYRHFKPDPVPVEIIEDALKVAAWAPSAKNQHPAKWIVINHPERIKEIMDHILKYSLEAGVSPEIGSLYKKGLNVVMGTASTLLLGYSRTDAINPPVDTALALYSAELVLQSQGIGTCWAGYLTRMCNQVPALRELLKLPEECQVYGALMLGYPDDETYIHVPNRSKQPDIQWL